MPLRALPLLLLALLPGCGPGSSPEPQGPLTGDSLVEALREGGLVLYLRHTETASSGVDPLDSLGDCAAQRSLTPAGRTDAKQIGRAFAALDIPVGEVLASPFCRTRETAELAFGRVETAAALLALDSFEDPAERAAAQEAGRRLVAAEPEDGKNTVLVGHVSNVRPITGAEPAEGGTVVFRPDGDGFLLVAEVAPQGWQRLAARH